MLRIIVISLALMTYPAIAASPDPTPPGKLAEAKAMIENGQADKALETLHEIAISEASDADLENLLGYANRKLGHFDKSRKHYERALVLDPKHKGALEYKGELELQAGNVASARELLRRLSDVCPDGCEELDDLLAAFAERGMKTKD